MSIILFPLSLPLCSLSRSIKWHAAQEFPLCLLTHLVQRSTTIWDLPLLYFRPIAIVKSDIDSLVGEAGVATEC